MPIRAAQRTASAVLASPGDAETVVLDSSKNHFLRPAASLVARLCRATLTNTRLILSEDNHDADATLPSPARQPIYELPLDAIDRVAAGPDTDEPSIELDIRDRRNESQRLVLWFRDAGWVLGAPERSAERDRWITALTSSSEHTAPVTQATRRVGAAGAHIADADLTRIKKVLAGTYDVVRPIGRGGMGLVYEGRDRKLDRPVAIKKLRPEIRMNAGEKARFLVEARLSASLHHPFIVDIYAVVEEGPEMFLVFEYVDGRTLQEHLHERGPMPAAALQGPLDNICAALSYAHRCQVVHRDLKPANIMLTTLGYAKVMDFGIARYATEQASLAAGDGDTSGTAPYMAPEQERGQSDARSDLFALGVTLYEVLTGQLPFPGPHFYLQKERGTCVALAQAAPGTPAAWAAAVERCLQFDAGRRFQSIDEFAAAIRRG